MGNVAAIMQALEIALIVVGILVLGRLYFVLGDLRKSLIGLDQTRVEIAGTLKRVESVADTAEHLMREEVTPTLQLARTTLANVELTTRNLAETSQVARKVAGLVEDARDLFSGKGPIAKVLMAKAGGIASGLLSGFATGLKSVIGLGGQAKKPKAEPKAELKPVEEEVAIPATETTNAVLKADRKEAAGAKPERPRH